MKKENKVDGLAMLEKQIQEAPDDLIGQVQAALGTTNKEETVSLIRKDPEARRIVARIIGTASPLGAEASLMPSAPDQQLAERMYGMKKPNVTF